MIRKASKKLFTTKNKVLENVINTIHKLEPRKIKLEENVCKMEKKALTELKNLTKTSLEIKKADKTDTWIIMEKKDYKDKLVLAEHLSSNTYKKAELNSNHKVYNKLKNLITKHTNCLTKNEKNVILDQDWKNANFYALPKVHKCQEILSKIKECQSEYIKMKFPTSLKSRPICGGPQAVTQGASKLLEKILSPLVKYQRSYVKDEWSFVRKFPHFVNRNCNLISCDIISLYTSIPTDLGLKALKFWIEKFRHTINTRFSTQFILELSEFVLSNNYFIFNNEMYYQITGVSMGTIFAPPYACLTVGFLEETELFPKLLPSKYDPVTCEFIIENFFRFMDDGNTLLPKDIIEDEFLHLLNSMHPNIQFTIGKPDIIRENGICIQKLVFLSLILHLDSNGNTWTNVFYKETNTHEYLRYDSHHPEHVKKNIPYVLAKRIIVFTSKDDVMNQNLIDLKKWLIKCGYPTKVIEQGVKNALLQGPAPKKTDAKIIPLISTFSSNLENKLVIEVTKQLIKNSKNERINQAFKEIQLIQAFRQPKNLLRTLTNSSFNLQNNNPGTYKCIDKRCKICKLYLREGNTFLMSNGKEWHVKCFSNCNSHNVIYYLVCAFCEKTTYIGIAESLRERTNNHISCCRHGNGDNIFDNHVFNCAHTKNVQLNEPYFLLYIMMTLNDYNKLHAYESKFHADGLDTMNCC